MVFGLNQRCCGNQPTESDLFRSFRCLKSLQESCRRPVGFVIPSCDNLFMSTIEKSPSFIDVSAVSSERLEAELCQFAADLSAGTARWLMMVAEYDRRRVWEQWECRSMASWLVGHCGVSLITARQYVHVAQTVEKFPLLWAEFLAGGLSYSRVRALCRFITPSSEADLVRMAKFCTAPQLERLAA
jgi:hypothetical protein